MLIMRATDEAVAAFENVELDQIIEAMGRFNDEIGLGRRAGRRRGPR